MNSNEWARRRFETFQKKLAEEKLRASQQPMAISRAPAMLARLREQVIEDLKAYDAAFGMHAQLQHCKSHFEDVQSDGVRTGFVVSLGTGSVRLTLQRDTNLIHIELSEGKGGRPNPICVEVLGNDVGSAGYCHGDGHFVDEYPLSRTLILDPMLCG